MGDTRACDGVAVQFAPTDVGDGFIVRSIGLEDAEALADRVPAVHLIDGECCDELVFALLRTDPVGTNA